MKSLISYVRLSCIALSLLYAINTHAQSELCSQLFVDTKIEDAASLSTEPPKSDYALTIEQSKEILGYTEAELISLNIPQENITLFHSLNEFTAFLWMTPQSHPSKKVFFKELIESLSSDTLVDGTRLFRDLKSFTEQHRNSIEDESQNTVEASEKAKSSDQEQTNADSTKEEFVSITRDLQLLGLPQDLSHGVKELAEFLTLSGFIFNDFFIKNRPSFSYKVGRFFGHALFPYRKSLVHINTMNSLNYMTSQRLIDLVRVRFHDFIIEGATGEETIAALKYFDRIEGRPTHKLYFEYRYQLLVNPEANIQIPKNLKEAIMVYNSSFLDKVADEILHLSSLEETQNVELSASHLENYRQYLLQHRQYPPKVASFMSALLVYSLYRTLPIKWDLHTLRAALDRSLSQDIALFRRQIAYLNEKNRPQSVQSNPEETVVRQPVYYLVSNKPKSEQAQYRNPNKRKNQVLQANENENETPREQIAIVSFEGEKGTVHELHPYDNAVKKELGRLPQALIDRIHHSYLPEILRDPRSAGATLTGYFPRNWFKYPLWYMGTDYRIAYAIEGKQVRILSIGPREKFYNRLAQRLQR